MTAVKPLRIAIWHNLPAGGGKRALYLAARYLASQGHTLNTFCPDSAALDAWPLNEFGSRQVLPLREVRRAGPFRGQWPAFYDALDRLDTMVAHAHEAAEAINAGDFDVVFVNPCQYLAVPALGRLLTKPSVLWLHEPWRWLYECGPAWPWHAPEYDMAWWSPRFLKRSLESLMGAQGARIQAREEARNAGAYTRLLANSRFARESLLRAYGLDAMVCYPAVDATVFRPGESTRERIVLAVGALYPNKRPDRAIRAVGAIPLESRPKLLWIGHEFGQSYREELQTMADSLGVEFEVRPNPGDAVLVEAMTTAALLICTPHLEPFGLTPLEANACGTPVVAIAEGGLRETLVHGDNALLVDHDDPHALATAMRTLLDDPAAAAAMGERGRARVLAEWQPERRGRELEGHLLAVTGATRV